MTEPLTVPVLSGALMFRGAAMSVGSERVRPMKTMAVVRGPISTTTAAS